MDHGQGLALPRAERGSNRMNVERWQQVTICLRSAVSVRPRKGPHFLIRLAAATKVCAAR